MNLTIGVALARLLTPADYGLLGMVMVTTGLVGVLADLGLSAAVVQKQDLSQRELSGIFWFGLVVAGLVGGVIAAVSPWAAALYGQPKVVPLMCVVALSFPIMALGAVQGALVQKAMRFRAATVVHLVATLTAGLLALAAAWAGWQVWALVVQSLVTAALGVVGVWRICDWRPDWTFARRDLARIWDFSLNLMGFQLVNYFARKADSFLIGRFLGAGALGFYTLAYTLMLYPISNFISVAQGVMMPALAQVQSEPARAAGAYIRACGYLAFLILPAMVGLALVAPEAVLLVYGPQWAETGQVLQILAWVGTFQPFVSLVGALFVARGLTRLFFWWGMGASAVTVLGFVVGLKWGIIGVASAYLTTEVLLTVFGMPWLYRQVEVGVKPLLQAMAVPAAAAGGMGVTVFVLKAGLFTEGISTPLVVVTACVVTGVVVYGTLLWLLKGYFWSEFKGEFGRIFGARLGAVTAEV
ncbi:MAG: hypothetical protein RL514_2280 [Verrucomicrobiota bacterium]|jgi:PST family polysaccharide transporter